MSDRKYFRRGPFDGAEMYEGEQANITHEAVMDYLRMNAIGLNPLQGSGFGLDFTSRGYFDYGHYIDDEGDYEDSDDENAYSGFSSGFLARGLPKPRSHNRSLSTISPHTSFHPRLKEITHEEAERLTKNLADEKLKLTEKTEKKKLKKLRQKERKRQEKLKEVENGVNRDLSDGTAGKPTGLENKCENTCSKPPHTDPVQKDKGTPVLTESKEPSDEERSEEESMASELEELDMTSSFVSKAATIVKRKLEQKPKPEKKERKITLNKPQERPKEGQKCQQKNCPVPSSEVIVERSFELAVIGYEFAKNQNFDKAVTYFTEAIKYNPKEYKLFGNRSFCYEKMQQYDKSLADAEISLTMNPNWIKGLYRKGRSLVGLKRFTEAEQAFKEVLNLDGSCVEATQELMKAQLMHKGFTREQSTNAIIIYGTVEKALEVLTSIPDLNFGSSSNLSATTCPPVDETWEVSGKKGHSSFRSASKPSAAVKASSNKSLQQPELFPIWVGNLVPTIEEKTIQDLFSFAGEIYSIRLLSARRCAFVNYTRNKSCERAIQSMNGMEVNGTKLSVRYPDRIYTHLGMSKGAQTAVDLPSAAVKTSAGECFYWRNSGCCIKKDNCIFRHVPEHRGIDKGKGKTSV